MTRPSPWRWTFAVLASFSLVAAACVGGGDGDTEREVTGDLSGQTIEAAAVWTGAEEERFGLILDAFEQETGATVNYTPTGDDIAAVLGPRIEAGDPPDVAVLPQPGLLLDYVDQGVLQPIEDVAGDEIDENFPAGVREVGTVDDTLYAVWFKGANKSTVWYNVNVFNDAGVEPPEDWDQLQQVAQTISDSGVTPYSIGAGDGWTLTDWFENIYLRIAGGDMYDQLANHEIAWTDQSVKDALAAFADVVANPDLIAGGTSGALQTDFNTSVTQVFADPQDPDAAIVYEADFVAGVITGETESEVGVDADFFLFPSIEGSEKPVVGGGDLAVLMSDSEGGRALIEFLATPAAAEIWAQEGGFIATSDQVDPSIYPDEAGQLAAEAFIASGDDLRYDMSDLQPSAFGATTGEGMWGLLQEFVRNPDDIDGVTQQLEDAANQAFGG
ncbi:MAG: ABC transporter substrate-binding protein [Actinomycetota bacterium]